MRIGITTTILLLAIAILVLSPPVHSDELGAVQRASYPKVLRGVWDLAPNACNASAMSDSDSRFEISRSVLQGYEHTDTPRSIRRISDAPQAWRIVAISDIAPVEIQGGAEIFILEGDYLTISDGTFARTYVRCK